MKKPILLLAVSALLSANATAQKTTVDYPDSTLTNPPKLLFPFYTFGGGGSVRYQTMCPGKFASLPKKQMMVTKVGIQIAGQERYSRFEVRFGSTKVTQLQNCFKANLADDRLQHDLSNTVLQGGGNSTAPANKWVELDLDHPFLYKPGEGLVLDIIASAAVPGKFCLTGTGTHSRLWTSYNGSQACGTISGTNGLKFRIVFEDLGFPTYGTSCKGTGGYAPMMSGIGSSQTGRITTVAMRNALGGAPTLLAIGGSRTKASFGRLPLSLGGSCAIATSLDLVLPLVAGGSGAGNGNAALALRVPNNASLRGSAAFLQWIQVDTGSTGTVPLTTSEGLILLIQ